MGNTQKSNTTVKKISNAAASALMAAEENHLMVEEGKHLSENNVTSAICLAEQYPWSAIYKQDTNFVHGRFPYATLKPDPVLRNIILSLPIRKVVFTNADKAHAAKIIARLGLEDSFERIISFETLNPNTQTESPVATDISSYIANPNPSVELPKTPVICKPSEGAFEQVFKMTNINPHKTLFFDDSISNIQTGKRVGLHTVLVGTSHKAEGVDIALEHIHNIREALPELWDAVDDKAKEIRARQKFAIEAIA
ncbi:unnamed protein product [Eruca vesicaria subsp. sativa]|uniref:Uncharacterized protein n=1 Tax=Eruca vesicaria subsp. sativa TaxID=29727 RepID=A0ABC8L3G1_ERUVS|nr:unnamed protein product [Eruca vesicaria subsp. sativa]